MTIPLDNPVEGLTVLKKANTCFKCKIELRHRVHRGFIMKTLFNWLPVKRYYCYQCERKRYTWVK